MKTHFIIMLFILIIICTLSILYLNLVQKEKVIDEAINKEKLLNQNLKVLLESKLSPLNISKLFKQDEYSKLENDDIIKIEESGSTNKE
ncbi:MAG: hypothetical protein KBG82_04815 [Spirochaetes bacterium]|nr:hypothetical protein [Spirochaetota bacterium]NLJ04481.1 hypothetical protein [Exilispira sp.]HOV46019.1 hypothetical protein [Exilispira sp.]HQJ40539.1 hypothetical protein [Exilispira sp.]HQQ18904.1 hypothetical protein [Exilispira sp.]